MSLSNVSSLTGISTSSNISLTGTNSNTNNNNNTSNSSNSGKENNLVLIHMIQEALVYAKLQFLNSDSGGQDNEGVSLCDTYLTHLRLLQSLLVSKSLPTTS